MIARSTVVGLGISQLVGWGVTYYLVGALADRIAADFGWSMALVQGGFSAALLVMGLTSPWAGRLIDRHGGRPVMAAGSVLSALGCAMLAGSHTVATYYAAWIVLGFGMRLTLYDAAFATLARIAGPQARTAIAQITLFGGLASTTFWPIGHALAERLGWRGAVLVYAGFALATLALHLALPAGRHADQAAPTPAMPERGRPAAGAQRDGTLAAGLYALIATLTAFVSTSLSAHLIGLLGGLGIAAGTAVWIASLCGIGQSLARLAQVVFGGRLHALDLNVAAAAALAGGLAIGLGSAAGIGVAVVFALVYGAANGLLTIARGTLPLVLFDVGTYGSVVGRLLAPGFFVSAAAPLVCAWVVERAGAAAALGVIAAMAGIVFIASFVLHRRFRSR